MLNVVYWLAVLVAITGLGVLGAVGARAYMAGENPAALFFKPRPEPRLEVIEQANMDGRRKLVLIRRDDIEHLVMLGGPVDVVIETGIGEKKTRAVETIATVAPPLPATATVFTRQPRTLGQTVPGETDSSAKG